MYNKMDISIFGFKFNLEILILIGIVYLILVGHTVCGCCNFYRNIEGFNDKEGIEHKKPHDKKHMSKNEKESFVPVAHPSNKKQAKKEGFVGANTNYGESSEYSVSSFTPVNTANWGMADLTVVPGQPISKAVQGIIDRPNQQLPLPEGQLSLFDNMPFSPNCCPNAFSSSMGCACMNTDTYNYLITRAGNNVPYSEY
uniref:Uncharacterized protein n=1 Tax=viral metagenome TaxID=1070528 RepID=A0A6C0DJ67_9ZZZZ